MQHLRRSLPSFRVRAFSAISCLTKLLLSNVTRAALCHKSLAYNAPSLYCVAQRLCKCRGRRRRVQDLSHRAQQPGPVSNEERRLAGPQITQRQEQHAHQQEERRRWAACTSTLTCRLDPAHQSDRASCCKALQLRLARYSGWRCEKSSPALSTKQGQASVIWKCGGWPEGNVHDDCGACRRTLMAYDAALESLRQRQGHETPPTIHPLRREVYVGQRDGWGGPAGRGSSGP